MRKFVVLAIIFAYMGSVSAAVLITEFLPNPKGDDAAPMPQGEWVELYNNGTGEVTLDGFVLYDSYDTHELYITDTNINGNMALQPGEYIAVYRDGDSDFGLNTDGDKVRLYDGYPVSNSSLINDISYTSSTEGYSWALIDGSWQQAVPTPGYENQPNAKNETGIVGRVIDGDTLELTTGERVRLIGIDAPETGEDYYEESKVRLKDLVESKQINLENDVEDKDRYDRLLRYIYIDDIFVNLIMVEEGFAKAYPYQPNTRYEPEFEEAEDSAKGLKKGIWSDSQDYVNSSLYVGIRINEIMYDPEGTDNNKEFVEIYSENEIDLSDFMIGDSSSNDSLTLLQHYDSDYYLITEEGFNISGIEASVYSAGAAIGNNLNTEDSLYLYHKDGQLVELVDNLSYTDACESGYSLEYSNGNLFCSFYLGGTPGKPNSNRSRNYTQLVINEFFPDPKGDDTAPMPGGEFIELYNYGDNDADLAAFYFKDSAGHELYISDVRAINGTIIRAKDYLAVYMNGFSGLLNDNGFEEIGLYSPEGDLIDKVSYDGSKEDLSWSLVDNIWQYRLPTPGQMNLEDEPEMESIFRIEKVENLGSDSGIKFGDIAKVRFSVYKGDTSKSSIKLYIENDEDRITKVTRALLDTKFTNYTLTLPLQIYPNCNEKLDDGNYYVGLGWTSESEPSDSLKIKISGINPANCDKIYVEKTPRKGTVSHSLLEYPESVEIGEEFTIKVEIANDDGNDHYLDLYSYVYKGSKCYSPSREENKKKVLVKAGETEEFDLINLVKEAEPGGYKLKVKLKREDQKTEKEITKDISLENKKPASSSEKITSASTSAGRIQQLPVILNAENSRIAYESTDSKAKSLANYFMIALFIILIVILAIKNKEKI